MSQGVADLTSKVNQLHSAISSVGSAANSTFSNLSSSLGVGAGQRGLGVSGNQNVMFGSLAGFSTPTPSANVAMNAVTPGIVAGEAGGPGGGGGGGLGLGRFSSSGGAGYGAMALAQGVVSAAVLPVKTAFASMIDTNTIVNRAGSYFQSAQFGNGISRAKLENATFSALAGQITSMGSDARMANILTSAGYMPGSQDYLQTVAQVSGAARTLGMPNENAAAAMGALGSGSMGANLYQYGVTTLDAKGNTQSFGNIARQLYNTMALPGTTPESVMGSIKNGVLAGNFQSMGITGDLQTMMTKAFQDIAAGKNPDLASARNSQGNQNPFDPLYRINASQTGIAGASESAAIQGLSTAAGTVETFNNAMKDTIVAMEGYKAYLDGLSGSNAGKGISTGVSGIVNIGKKIVGAGLMAFGGPIGIAAGATLAFSPDVKLGGGTPGYGNRGGGPRGGGTPGNALMSSNSIGNAGLISATYGDVDSAIWGKTGGKHLGTDYAVGVGTDVVAVKDGVVSSQTLNPDYGDAVVIDHLDGYSTIYAHLSGKSVSPGVKVSQGDKIGKSGQSGNTTGPGLHFEVQKGQNNPVDPNELQNAIMPVSTGSAFNPISTNALSSAVGLASITGGLGADTIGSPNPTGGYSADAVQMKDWLMSQGLSENGAFGVVANLMAESSLNTGAVGDGGTSYGIAQWHLGRKENLLKFAKDKGLEPSSIEAQRQFLMEELSSYGTLLNTLKDPKVSQMDATGAFLTQFERPKDQSSAAISRRYNRGLGALNPKGGGTTGYGADITVDASTVGSSAPTVGTTSGNGAATNVNIYLTISQASESEAVLLAKRVKSLIQESTSDLMIGSS
jgi:murein DD-endopeptidase MepM/ murein hydrolase activator NlpD